MPSPPTPTWIRLLLVSVVWSLIMMPTVGQGLTLPSMIVPLLMIVECEPNDRMPMVEAAPVIAPLLVTVSPPVPNSSIPVPPAARLMVAPFPFVNVLALTPKKAVPSRPTVMSPLLLTVL